jgi:Spy/CpxP family protein refolding chaperone
MNSRQYFLPSRSVRYRILMLFLLNFALQGFAEDPIVVHYSDPSLTRMEARIGVTPAQKDRFEDIVVKYRDPLTNSSTDGSAAQKPAKSGRHRGVQNPSQDDSDASSQADSRGSLRRTRGRVTREELDELATILTPAQIKKFQELNNSSAKP